MIEGGIETKKNRLTLCTVSYESRSCLDLNWSLTASLNDLEHVKWLVVENSDPSSGDRVAFDDERFTVIDGFRLDQVPLCEPEIRVCYHHALALNKLLPLVRSRYVLFCDPDFFIVRPHWIQDVTKHMEAHNLSFFGATYHPGSYDQEGRFFPSGNYRYFPCTWCLFIDLDKIPRSNIDFTPGLRGSQSSSESKMLKKRKIGGFLKKIGSVIPMGLTLGRRLGLRQSAYYADTGYRVYLKFFENRRHLRECLTLHWRNPLFAGASSIKEALKKGFIKWIVPECISPYPKDNKCFTTVQFKEFSLPDVLALGWCEYFWQGEPFGFHVRPGMSGRTLFGLERSVELHHLKEIVNDVRHTWLDKSIHH